MKIGELFVALGFKTDNKKIVDYQNNITNAKLKTLGLVTATTAAFYAVAKFSDSTLKYAVSLKNFAVQTGLSTDELEKWRFVTERNDITAGELISTIKNLQKAQAEIRLGVGNIRPWQLLGIDPNENPFRILEQLREKVKNLDPALATSVLGQLGIGQNFLNILKNSNLEFDKLNKKFLLTEEETKDLIILNKAFKNVIFSIRGLRNRLVALSAEPLMKIARAVSNVSNFFIDLFVSVKNVLDKFKTFKNVLGLTTAVIAAYFFPVTSGIVLAIGLIDDLYVMLQGGESVIGKMLKALDFEPLIEQLRELNPLFESIFKRIVDGTPPIETMMSSLKRLNKHIFQTLIDDLTDVLKTINQLIDVIPKLFKSFSDIYKKADETIKTMLDKFFKTPNIIKIIGELLPSKPVKSKSQQKLFESLIKKDQLGFLQNLLDNFIKHNIPSNTKAPLQNSIDIFLKNKLPVESLIKKDQLGFLQNLLDNFIKHNLPSNTEAPLQNSIDIFLKNKLPVESLIKNKPLFENKIKPNMKTISNNNNQTNNTNINVEVIEATTPKATAQAVVDSLQSQLSDAYFQIPNFGVS